MWETLRNGQFVCRRHMMSGQLREFIDKSTEEEWTGMKETGFMPY